MIKNIYLDVLTTLIALPDRLLVTPNQCMEHPVRLNVGSFDTFKLLAPHQINQIVVFTRTRFSIIISFLLIQFLQIRLHSFDGTENLMTQGCIIAQLLAGLDGTASGKFRLDGLDVLLQINDPTEDFRELKFLNG